MNLLEHFTLPADHPLRLQEQEKAQEVRVDYESETLRAMGGRAMVYVLHETELAEAA